MPRIYLDSNIYIFGLHYLDSDSAFIIKECRKGTITVIQSDYLIEEVLNWHRRNLGKDWVGKASMLMVAFPRMELIHESEWKIQYPKWKDLVDDKDDIPHICSYFAGGCDCFVTTNRKLTQMKIGQHVAFQSPEEFAKALPKYQSGYKPDDEIWW